ncbi:MAG: hypothetical protein K6G72_01540 [Lachnospiraceae bacterium]|nr:hypothetical protein [Lachnospiraceae bacterium]
MRYIKKFGKGKYYCYCSDCNFCDGKCNVCYSKDDNKCPGYCGAVIY